MTPGPDNPGGGVDAQCAMRTAASGERVKAAMFAAVLMVVITTAYVWIISAGTWVAWPTYTSDYCRLADAFLHGRVSIRPGPPPELLKLSDPYDPTANERFRLHDAILFGGNYYLYWGPTPALLLTAVWATRETSPTTGDEYLVLGFALGTVLSATKLLLLVRTRLFPERPAWTIVPGVVSLGLGAPMLFTLARAGVYEAAILGGQFFMLAGLCAMFAALSGSARAPEPPRKRWLAAAGVCWATAVGSRISLAPAVAALAALAAWRLWADARAARRRWPDPLSVVCLAAPLVLVAVLLGAYNFARFHSAVEFGQRFQLAGVNLHAMPRSSFLAVRFVLPNTCRYLFQRPFFSTAFPYVIAGTANDSLRAWFHLPPAYGMEAVVGVVWTQPFLVFAFFAVAAALRKAPADRPEDQGLKAGDRGSNAGERGLKAWLVWSVLAAALLGIAPALCIIGSTMRYLADSVPACTVLACLGFWEVLRQGDRGRSSRTAAAIAAALVSYEVIIAAILSINGYFFHFKTFNPALYLKMQSLFSR